MSTAPHAKALHEWPLWEIFVRSKQGLEHKHCGSLHASDAQHALQQVLVCPRLRGQRRVVQKAGAAKKISPRVVTGRAHRGVRRTCTAFVPRSSVVKTNPSSCCTRLARPASRRRRCTATAT